MKQPSDLLGPLRVPFLLLPPACVAAGAGAAFWRTGRIDWGTALLVLVGAVCAHASVNALNEYSDFRTGVIDHMERPAHLSHNRVGCSWRNRATCEKEAGHAKG